MKKIAILLGAVLLAAGTAQAKWWIFGKGGGEVGLKYLHVNGLSADETGRKMTIYRETLGPDGLVKIKGRAQAGRNKVGSVRVSIDDKATWQDAKLSDNGTFEHSFRPEEGRKYALLVEVTDTAGKTNKVDETRKELEFSGEKIQSAIQEALDAMFAAYSQEKLPAFMAHVGDDFAGDRLLLERAVKKDFDSLNGINIRYTLNNIAAGAAGRVFVSVTYNRFVVSNRTGASNTDNGSTEFVFTLKDGRPMLYSMKQPLMFGLSDADNVATGTVLGNSSALTLDDGGELGSGTVVTRSYTSPDDHFGYDIDAEAFEDCDGTSAGCSGNFFFMPAIPYIGADDNPETSARIGEIPGKNVSTVTLADIQAAATLQQVNTSLQGKTFGLKYGSNYYAIEVPSLSGVSPGPWSVTIKVKSF